MDAAATVTVDYAAPADCPSDADFWAAVAARAPGAARAEAGAGRGEWSLFVRIERARGGFAGRLRVRHGERTVERSVEDAACGDVGTALAVIAAIAVRPKEGSPDGAAAAPASAARAEPSALRAESPWPLRAGLGAAATTLLSPWVSLGAAPFVEIEQPASPLGLRVRLGGHFATSFPIRVGTATAQVTSALGRLELGGLRVGFARSFFLRAGAFVETGALVASVEGVPGARSVTAPFVDVGAALRLAWEPSFLFVEAGLSGVAVVTRHVFELQPGPVVLFEVPPGGAAADLAVGARFF